MYDRLLEYQPGWLALPLGAAELALVIVFAHVLAVRAPLGPAVALFAVGWLVAQILAHAVLPLVHLTYDQDGGELGRAGPLVGAAVLVLLSAATGAAYAARPPTVYLSAGVHQGPLVIDRRETLVGRSGAVVRGGIVVDASGVTIRGVNVVGGENGIDVENVRNVVLDRVSVSGAQLDGIHVRHSSVSIRNCLIDSGTNAYAQGIDISFAYDLPMSEVSGCTIVGGSEGIVTHSVQTMLDGQPRPPDAAARDHRDGDVDGDGRAQRRQQRARDRDLLRRPLDVRGRAQHRRRARGRIARRRTPRAAVTRSSRGSSRTRRFASNTFVGNARGSGAFASSQIRPLG